MEVPADVYAKLVSFGQQHLVQFWDSLTTGEREHLLSEIAATNFEKLLAGYKACQAELSGTVHKVDERLQPLPTEVLGSVRDGAKLTTYWECGLREVAKGHVAVLLLAGGQGTRLNVPFPKGMFDVRLLSGKTLYELQAQRIQRIEALARGWARKHNELGANKDYPGTDVGKGSGAQQNSIGAEQNSAGAHQNSMGVDEGKMGAEENSTGGEEGRAGKCRVMWYIMTSEHTKPATEAFLAEHQYFGIPVENIFIFEQFTLPALSFDGKVLLAKKHKLATAPGTPGPTPVDFTFHLSAIPRLFFLCRIITYRLPSILSGFPSIYVYPSSWNSFFLF